MLIFAHGLLPATKGGKDINQPKGVHVNKEVNKAAQADPLDAFVQEAIDQDSQQQPTDKPNVESAPAEKAIQDDVKPVVDDDKPSDGFQKRINKVTADKYEETRRADALQARLDKLENNPAAKVDAKAPTLEDHDYDEDAFNQANVSYQVQQELAKQANKTKQAQANAKAQQGVEKFNKQITALGKEDFSEKASAIPNLPEGVADALMQVENGAEMIYHLGTHLDKADALANMTPIQAMMELGRLSVEMNKKPEIKPSAAPEPIKPLQAGSALSSDIGDEMSIEAWMAKHN